MRLKKTVFPVLLSAILAGCNGSGESPDNQISDGDASNQSNTSNVDTGGPNDVDSCADSACTTNTATDTDSDGVIDSTDNCPSVANPDQNSMIGSNTILGDACDDEDGDGINDWVDSCPLAANTTQTDANGNGIGDVCECEPVSLVGDLNGNQESDPRHLTVFNNKLYFTARTSTADGLLFVYDGNEVSRVQGFPVGLQEDFVQSLFVFKENLYFLASEIAESGARASVLVTYDGNRMSVIKEFAVGDSTISATNAAIFSGVFQDKLYFGARRTSGVELGNELYAYDGNEVTFIADVNPGPEGSNPESPTPYRDKLYFTALTPDGIELQVYDNGEVSLVHDLTPGGSGLSSYPEELTVYKDKLYFTAITPETNTELFVFDGTDVSLAKEFYPGAD